MNGTVVGLAALAGLLLLLAGVTSCASSGRPATGRLTGPARDAFPDDDLPGFLAAPPGTPAVGPLPGEEGAAARRGAWALAGAAGAVLLVAGAVAAVVRTEPNPAGAAPSAAASSAPPPPPPAVASGDVSAEVTARGLVLGQAPAGVVAGFPRVTLTSAGDRAVLHLELPVADCLTPVAPARPEDAGCLPTATEHADLATPALHVSRAAGRLTLSGKLPTYLRPDGSPPVWTGRSRDVTVTVDLPPPAGGGPLPARGSVTVGDATAAALPDPALTTVTYGG